jgi:hypothetical protein
VPKQKAESLPLADDDRPETAADVGIDRPQFLDAFRCAPPEVRHPTVQVLTEFLHARGE